MNRRWILLHVLLHGSKRALIVPIVFRINVAVGVSPIQSGLQANGSIGNQRSPMIHHDPVGNLNRLALLVIIVANLVHVHALWNGIAVYPQAGKKHGMPQNRHILKLLCHGIYPHRASPLSFGFLWELSSMKSPFGSVSRSFRNAREIVLPFRSR